MTTRTRKAKPVEADVEVSASVDASASVSSELARCNVPGCDEHPEHRGLCSAHRQTHRGLADPKGDDRG